MAIKHLKTSIKPDSSDTAKIQPSDWNADHISDDPVNETPIGEIDGETRSFTLAQTPSPASSLQLFRNGVLQLQGVDYTLTGATIRYEGGKTPKMGDWHRAYYRI